MRFVLARRQIGEELELQANICEGADDETEWLNVQDAALQSTRVKLSSL